MINQNIRKIPSNNDLNSNTEINEIGSNHANQQTSGNRIHFKPEINEEIFNETLKEIIEKRNQEERKANGRLVAVIIASLVIFLTIYHAWIRNSGMLSGIVVPAVIMLSFGVWVIILAKRDKARNELFDKYLQEVSRQHRQLIAEANKSKQQKNTTLSQVNSSHNDVVTLHYKNELSQSKASDATTSHRKDIEGENSIETNKLHNKYSPAVNNNKHRKPRWHKQRLNLGDYNKETRQNLPSKRPSLRQILFRPSASKDATKLIKTTPTIIIQDNDDQEILIQTQHKYLQQHNNNNKNNITPIKKKVVRWSSAP